MVVPVLAAVKPSRPWYPGPDMSVPRYAATATVIQVDGTDSAAGPGRLGNTARVLVVGGYYEPKPGEGVTLSAAEIYDPAANRFTPTGSLHHSRNFHTATLLHDGRVLIAGGYDVADGTLDDAEVYDPVKGAFSPLPAKMTSPRELFTATLLPDGRVLLVGGFNTHTGHTLRTAELYDPRTQRFTSTGEMTTSFGRFGHAALLLPPRAGQAADPGRVLIVGGKERTSRTDWRSLASAEIYDVGTGKFTPAGQMKFSRDRPQVAWIPVMHKALIVGGKVDEPDVSTDAAQSEWFDPEKAAVEQDAFSPGPTLRIGRMAHTLTRWDAGQHKRASGSWLVVGGWSTRLGRSISTAEEFVPDPQSPLGGRFMPAGDVGDLRHDHAAVELPDGRVMALGGEGVGSHGVIRWIKSTALIGHISLTQVNKPNIREGEFGTGRE